ncbi:MAG: hypothetical protein DBY32_07970 [Phascolarctobacterium sp.]|nr:MAG: hypothetical protein DBY32_07970 [Phascolarctobacterium sp.]
MIRKYYTILLKSLMCIFEYVKVQIYLLIIKNRSVLMGIPWHGNIGDQAIVVGEEFVLKNIYENNKIIKISYNTLIIIMKFHLPNFILRKEDILFLHGGGNLGTLYINEEIVRRYIIETYKNNKIIIMPISIFFHNNEKGNSELIKSIKCYSNHADLTIITRDKNSYSIAKKYFIKNNIKLLPDIVNVLDVDFLNIQNVIPKYDVVLFLRKDIEKVLSTEAIILLLEKINENNLNYLLTDTIENVNIYSDSERLKYIVSKIKLAAESKIVITDRFHGMIFSIITHTPVIVFKSYDSKITYGVKWFANLDYVYYMENFNIENIIKIIDKNVVNKNNVTQVNNCKNILLEGLNKILK